MAKLVTVPGLLAKNVIPKILQEGMWNEEM